MTWNTRLLTWEQAPVTWNRSLITCNSRLCHELGFLSHTLGLLWHEIHVFWHGNRRLFKHVRNFFFGRQRKFSLDVRDVRKNISNRTSETSFFRAHPWELWSDPCGAWLVAWLKILRALRAQASYGYSPPCIFRLICIGFIVVLFRRQTKLNSVICMTWRIRIRDMTCLYMWRESIDTFSLNCIGFTVCCSVTKQNWILSYVWHDLFIFVTWRIHMCDMTQSHVWHDTFICVTRRIYVCDMAHSYAWSDSIICVIWLIHMCDLAQSYVRNDTFICVTRYFHFFIFWTTHVKKKITYSYVWHDLFVFWHMCDMTHSNAWHDVFICVTWLIHMCDLTHSYVWHGSVIRVTWLIHMCDMTHSYVYYDPCICATWLIHMYFHDCVRHIYVDTCIFIYLCIHIHMAHSYVSPLRDT